MQSAVSEYYQWWRTSIERGSALEAMSNYNNVVAHSRNILAYITATPAIDAQLRRAIKASQSYFLAQRNMAARTSNAEALAAMDALAQVLDGAEPSEVATALGMG